MPRISSFYVVKEVVPPPSADIRELAQWHQIPAFTSLDQWALERLVTNKARKGEWCINLSVTTVISLLAELRARS